MNPNSPIQATDAGRPASALNVFAGIWLIISPWVLGFSGLQIPLRNVVLVGIAVLVLAVIHLGAPRTPGLSWVNCLLGLWLIVSPAVLGFTAAATAMGNAIILGVLVVVFSLWAALGARTTAPLRR